MNDKEKKRIMMAKFGLDGHSNGIKIVSKWLLDAGYEVIYMGLYNTPEGVIKAAQEENVDVIGCSFLEGAHIFFVKKMVKLAVKSGLDRVPIVVGGVIPPDDIPRLKKLGVKTVFPPGTLKEAVLDGFKALLSGH